MIRSTLLHGPVPAGRPARAGLCLVAALLVLGAHAPRASAAQGDVYHFVDADGTPHFSDQALDPRYRLLRHGRPDTPALLADRPQRLPSSEAGQRIEGAIVSAARESRIDAALLHAVVQVESAYNPRAVSRKGALGLMQLMPATARRYGVTDPFDAAQNLLGGARHLRELLDQFHGSKELALAAYNAGAGAVLAHGRRVPPFAETTRYVPAVLQAYERRLREARVPPPEPQRVPAEKR